MDGVGSALTTLGTRWRCTTRSLVVVYGLDDTITILKATYVQGEGGAAEATWIPWRTGLRARIQPVQSHPAASTSRGRRSPAAKSSWKTSWP